jgi:hypothetical protein
MLDGSSYPSLMQELYFQKTKQVKANAARYPEQALPLSE